MKYQFEIEKEITSCDGCPCVGGGYEDYMDHCNLTGSFNTSDERIPDDCPLIKIES